MAGRYSKRIRREEPDVVSTEFECFVCHMTFRLVREVSNSLAANNTSIDIVKCDRKITIILVDCSTHR